MSDASLSVVETSKQNLTRFSAGSIKELSTIAWPLVLSFLSMSLMNFFNRLFLSHYSVEALESAVGAMNLAFLFQVPCTRITSIAQIFVARFAGSQEWEKIGSVVWQMIWVSFLSLILTLPLGLYIGSLFFQGTVVERMGLPCFSCLMAANFLFPLGGALAAFFAGLGRTKTIIFSLAFVHIVQICLDKILIFGVPGILLPQGAFGAAISTVVAQALYCLILFILFLGKNKRSTYKTSAWQLQPKLMKDCFYVGTPRAIAKLLILVAWIGSAKILTNKGGDYLFAFSVGTSFHAFFSCLNEGLGQGLMTVASYYIGGRQERYLPRIAKASLGMLLGILSILSPFLLFFPKLLITTFFPQSLSPEQISILIHSCYGLWFFFLCDGLSWIGFGFLNALKETNFYLIYTAITVLFFNYLPIDLAYYRGGCNVEMIWWIMSLPCLASAIAYYFRIVKKLRAKEDLNLKDELTL